MRPRVSVTIAIFALGALALTACSAPAEAETKAADPQAPITFAATPLGDDPTAENPIEAFAELVGEATGREVDIVDVPDYTAVVEALRNHHVDIGFMSGFPSALAVNTGQVDALIAWPGNEDPVSTCLVLDGSPLKSLDDVKPETVVAFADPASSSGFFMPVAMLDKVGKTRDKDYKSMFSGGHDMSFIALKEKQVDVACTSTIFPTMAGKGNAMFPFEKGQTRSIGESGSMPVSVAVLSDQNIADDKRELLLEHLPEVFVEKNRERLGAMMEAMQGTEPVLEPKKKMFQPFVDIAAIANVDISDLG